MQPVDPIPDPSVLGENWRLAIYAKDQPQYSPLPALIERSVDGRVITRWKPTEDERAKLAAGADLCLEIYTFGNKLQPLRLSVWSDVLPEVP